MSTKATLAYGDKFHLYLECLDDENVYLELEASEYEAHPGSITVQIPLPIWEVIRTYQGANFDLVDKTDDELQKYAEDFVHDRLRRIKEHPGKGSIAGLFGFMTYGSADDPVSDQIQRGVADMKVRREKQQELQKAIDDLKAKQGK